MRAAKRSGALTIFGGILVVVLAACVSFSVKSIGAASIEDLQAENAYVALYMDHMTRYAADVKVFAPTDSNPGPCNKGGSKQACYDADVRAIADLTAMLSAIQGMKVPPRFVEADRLLRDALARNINGLDLRNRALAQGDDTLWRQHAPVLRDAQSAWIAAYAAFPDDNRPPLGP